MTNKSTEYVFPFPHTFDEDGTLILSTKRTSGSLNRYGKTATMIRFLLHLGDKNNEQKFNEYVAKHKKLAELRSSNIHVNTDENKNS